jgi:hypothetical protein
MTATVIALGRHAQQRAFGAGFVHGACVEGAARSDAPVERAPTGKQSTICDYFT